MIRECYNIRRISQSITHKGKESSPHSYITHNREEWKLLYKALVFTHTRSRVYYNLIIIWIHPSRARASRVLLKCFPCSGNTPALTFRRFLVIRAFPIIIIMRHFGVRYICECVCVCIGILSSNSRLVRFYRPTFRRT